jgi:hypothetical protein
VNVITSDNKIYNCSKLRLFNEYESIAIDLDIRVSNKLP